MHRDKRLLLPVARDMMKACCARYLRLELEREALQAITDDSGDDDAAAADSPEKLSRYACTSLAPELVL